MTRIEPNPYSPYADAKPDVRHIFPSPIFFPDPEPGVLALVGCERLAVVPEELTNALAGDGVLPDGLCPACVAAMRGEEPPEDARQGGQCRECEGRTKHDGLCALCRQQAHEAWWPNRDATAAVHTVNLAGRIVRYEGRLTDDHGVYRVELCDCGWCRSHNAVCEHCRTGDLAACPEGFVFQLVDPHDPQHTLAHPQPASLTPVDDDEDGMCPACDTTLLERCTACGSCRCDRHDGCAPAAAKAGA